MITFALLPYNFLCVTLQNDEGTCFSIFKNHRFNMYTDLLGSSDINLWFKVTAKVFRRWGTYVCPRNYELGFSIFMKKKCFNLLWSHSRSYNQLHGKSWKLWEEIRKRIKVRYLQTPPRNRSLPPLQFQQRFLHLESKSYPHRHQSKESWGIWEVWSIKLRNKIIMMMPLSSPVLAVVLVVVRWGSL